jgi:serpin B
MRAAIRASGIALLCCAAAAIAAVTASGAATRPSQRAVARSSGSTAAGAGSTAASAENAFALDLLPLLGGSGNVVYSPYSIATALSMADAGAAGSTAAQIDRLLHAASESEVVANASEIRRALAAAVGSGSSAPQLDIANALWTQTGLALQSPFVSTLTNSFGAPPQSTDFSSDPAAAVAAINAWVASHTDQLITKLLGQGSITPATAFVLANAIYLKAHWVHPFDATRTHPSPFTTSSGAVVQVPFMAQDDTSYDYGAGTNYQAIDLPYVSNSLSMLAILPRGISLTAFDHGLTSSSLAKIAGSLRQRNVDLLMPKLKLSTQTSLNASLQALGMKDAFGSNADFSALTKQRALNISLVEHAADLKVDEQGTVAAAATAIIGPTAVERPIDPTVEIKLNHPYLLLLRDDVSGTILFVARVANPGVS